MGDVRNNSRITKVGDNLWVRTDEEINFDYLKVLDYLFTGEVVKLDIKKFTSDDSMGFSLLSV